VSPFRPQPCASQRARLKRCSLHRIDARACVRSDRVDAWGGTPEGFRAAGAAGTIAHSTPVCNEPLTRSAPTTFWAGEPAVKLLTAGSRARRFPASACARQAAARLGWAHATRLHGARRVGWAAAHRKDGPVLPHTLQPPHILQHSLYGLPVLPSLIPVTLGIKEHDSSPQHGIRWRGGCRRRCRPWKASKTRILTPADEACKKRRSDDVQVPMQKWAAVMRGWTEDCLARFGMRAELSELH